MACLSTEQTQGSERIMSDGQSLQSLDGLMFLKHSTAGIRCYKFSHGLWSTRDNKSTKYCMLNSFIFMDARCVFKISVSKKKLMYTHIQTDHTTGRYRTRTCELTDESKCVCVFLCAFLRGSITVLYICHHQGCTCSHSQDTVCVCVCFGVLGDVATMYYYLTVSCASADMGNVWGNSYKCVYAEVWWWILHFLIESP